MSSNMGIQNYSEMEDKDKAYVVKLSAIILAAIITGVITGGSYSFSGGTALFGFVVFLVVLLGMSYFIKMQFDLSDMTDVQIIRHGIFVSLLIYIFLWTTIFNFMITPLN